MKRSTRASAALALVIALAAPMARAEEGVDAATEAKLTATLTEQGYEVRKIEREDGLIEAYVVKDGTTQSLFFDDALQLVKSEG